MTDRERAIKAIRRGAPLGEVVRCSCFTDPPTRNGCFGVCEDTVVAIIAAFEAVRAESRLEEVARGDVSRATFFVDNLGLDIVQCPRCDMQSSWSAPDHPPTFCVGCGVEFDIRQRR